MKLILIRGVPGTGKSTYAELNYPSYLHFEADTFMCDERGVYCWDKSLLYLAHTLCIKHTELALRRKKDVVVANTFTTHKELLPYLKLAEEQGAEVEVIKLTHEFGTLHNVPVKTLERMRTRMEQEK